MSALLLHFFTSPSAGPCSEPAGHVQHAVLSVSELGQTCHWQRRHRHLQVILHGQKRWQRRGRNQSLLTQFTPNIDRITSL